MGAEKPSFRTRRKFIVGLATVGGVGAVEIARPGFWLRMANAVGDWYDPPAKRQDPEVFDQTREAIEVSSKNTLPIKPAEARNLGVELNIPNPASIIPLKPTPTSIGEYYTKDPILKIPLPFDIPAGSRITVFRRATFNDTEIMDKLTVSGLPTNTIIYSLFDGRLFYGQTSNVSGVGTIASVTTTEVSGISYSLSLQFGAADLLIPEASQIKIDRNEVRESRELRDVEVKAGQPLFLFDEKNTTGSWLPGQLKIEAGIRLPNPQLPGVPARVYSPLMIKTINNKAVFIRP